MPPIPKQHRKTNANFKTIFTEIKLLQKTEVSGVFEFEAKMYSKMSVPNLAQKLI